MIDENTLLINKVNQFFDKEFRSRTADLSIFKNQDGSYELFNQFEITSENNKIKISKKRTLETCVFSSLKYAVTWCIFEQRNRINETIRIRELDRLIGSVDSEIKLHQNLIEKTKDIDLKLIYYAKLSQELAKKKHLIKEMDHFVKTSQQWQNDRFNKKAQF